MRAHLVAIILMSVSTPADAYLDPGSGSMLLYALASIGAMIAYTARGLIHKFTNYLVRRGSGNTRDLKDIDLVFYSEGKQYWQVFSPVLDALLLKGVEFAYLTSDKNDPGLKQNSSQVTAKYIGAASVSAAVMNHLSAKLVVMTTPQLGIFKLKRSKNVQHYAQLLHAPTDLLMYKRYSFDHYDSILCSGPHQLTGIRKLEEIRGTPVKKLYETGMTYYDAMLQNVPDIQRSDGKTRVLIAPTWGKNSLLARYGSDCIRPLLDDGIEVVLRPHPQSFLSEPEMMGNILNGLKPYSNLTIDQSASAEQSMAICDMLISDLSGIIFDYAFIFQKPVIIIDSAIDRGGLEAEYVDDEIWEISVREKLGELITEDDLPTLPSIVKKILLSDSVAGLEKFRMQSVYNFGRAGEVAAGQLLEILHGQSSEVPDNNTCHPTEP